MRSNSILRWLMGILCVIALSEQRCHAAEDDELDLGQVAELAKSIRNADIGWSSKQEFWPHEIKNASSKLHDISDQINNKHDKWQFAQRRGDRELLRKAVREYDPSVHFERRKVGMILLKQLEDEDCWIAAHVLLSRLFRQRVSWLEHLDEGNGYTHYWNGLIVEQRFHRKESEVRDEIRIPHTEEQHKQLLKHWTTFLTMKVPVND